MPTGLKLVDTRRFAVDPAIEFRVAVSQAKQRAREDVARAKTETDGTAAAREEVSELITLG
jgi:hypothetical protein